MVLRDDHGQPLNRMYGFKRLNDRAIDELIGICRGIIADRKVNQQEAEFLLSWMENNAPHKRDPIINTLYWRIEEMLRDDVLNKDEQEELFYILNEFTGETSVEHPNLLSSSLPLCSPEPDVLFSNKNFCLTGKFAYGPRRLCEAVVVERGGYTSSGVSGRTDYLVIGTFCSRDWIHTSYGRKIETAAEMRKTTGGINIISEDLWAEYAFRK